MARAMAPASAGLDRIIALVKGQGDRGCFQNHQPQSDSRLVEALSSGLVPVTVMGVGMILGAEMKTPGEAILEFRLVP